MSTSIRRLGSAYKWTKNGWAHSQEVVRRPTIQRGYQQTEFEEPEHISDIGLITRAYNQIQVGSIGLEFDQLPGPLRQLLYSPDIWHISPGGKLFRVVDEIEQVKVLGEWGSDKDEAEESDPTEEHISATRLFLEQAGIVDADSLYSETADALCSMVSCNPYFEPCNDEEQRQSTAPPPSAEVHPLPSLPEEVETEVQQITTEFKEQQAIIKQNTEGRKKEDLQELLETLASSYEERMEELISPILTLSLTSPFCGRGYVAPKKRYAFIPVTQPSRVVNAAEGRETLFYRLFGEAAACCSRDDLFGPFAKDTRQRLPSSKGPVPNPNYGKTERTGGFYSEIRGMHSSDKELALEWSMHPPYANKDGRLVESAFDLQRRKFINEWREQEKGDEESLRIAVWAWFDRVAGEKPAVYNDQGKLIEKRKVWKDSIWRQKRTEALADLFLTKPQWNAIYTMLGIIKQRISVNPTAEFSKERESVLKKLREIFLSIDNLSDLNAYMAWAQKRYWHHTIRCTKKRTLQDGSSEPIAIGPHRKTYEFSPSIIDRISVIDEINWQNSCMRKRKELQNRFMFGRYLARQIISTEPTTNPEQSVVCHDPSCDCMAIGLPTKAILPDQQSAEFIICSGCNQPVWLIDNKSEYPCQENILKDIGCARCKAKHLEDSKEKWEQRCSKCKLG